MSKTNDGGPAFPSHGSMGEVAHEGMTLRDYFAAKAMAAILPAWIECYCAEGETFMSSAAKHVASAINAVEMESTDWLTDTAYMIADEMLAEREARQ